LSVEEILEHPLKKALPSVRSVDELAFDFKLLLHCPSSALSSADKFMGLWEEANDAAMAYIDDARAALYIEFLKNMKASWRRNPAFN
jgi:hypothetical protein